MKKILVVDDDPDILDAIQLTLEDVSYSVATSEKGEYAEKLGEKNDLPDLIILDVLLSGKDGRMIARKLKSQPKTRHIPIIMISAHPSADKTALTSGADAFLPKPFELEELLTKVSSFLNGVQH